MLFLSSFHSAKPRGPKSVTHNWKNNCSMKMFCVKKPRLENILPPVRHDSTTGAVLLNIVLASDEGQRKHCFKVGVMVKVHLSLV